MFFDLFKKQTAPKKKILFLGASNTYGSGLHLFNGKYNTIESVQNLTQQRIGCPIGDEEDGFVKANRWSTKIAQYLDREEINESRAGGSPAEALFILQNTDITDVDYIVFEFSAIYSFFDRYFFGSTSDSEHIPRTPGEIEAFLTNGKKDRPELRERIKQWLIDFDPKAFLDEVMVQFEEELQKPRMQGKKIIVIWWRPHGFYNGGIVYDPEHYTFLKKYAVKFPIPESENNYSAHNMIVRYDYIVCKEHPLGQYLGFQDDHAGPKGNDLVAECIIKHIDEKESTNSW